MIRAWTDSIEKWSASRTDNGFSIPGASLHRLSSGADTLRMNCDLRPIPPREKVVVRRSAEIRNRPAAAPSPKEVGKDQLPRSTNFCEASLKREWLGSERYACFTMRQ